MPCHRNSVGHYSVHLYVYDLSNFGIDEEIKQYFFFSSVLHADLNTAIQTNCESK